MSGNRELTAEVYAELPTGTIGVTTDCDGPPTVRWHQPFNVWDLLSCELIPLSMQIHQVADVNVSTYHASIH